jgi:hypothetical protein
MKLAQFGKGAVQDYRPGPHLARQGLIDEENGLDECALTATVGARENR